MVLLEVRGLSFNYRNKPPVFSDLSFNIRRGEIIALLGPSGVGKTTLLHILKGTIPRLYSGKIDGTIELLGKNLQKYKTNALNQIITMQFQEPQHQLFAETVYDEICFGLRNFKLPLTRADEIMEKLGLTALKNDIPHNLSAGQKHKVVLASILVLDPQILLLDEPTLHLDYQSKFSLIKLLREIQAAKELALVIVDQDPEIIGELADRIFWLENGQIDERALEEVIVQKERFAWKEGLFT